MWHVVLSELRPLLKIEGMHSLHWFHPSMLRTPLQPQPTNQLTKEQFIKQAVMQSSATVPPQPNPITTPTSSTQQVHYSAIDVCIMMPAWHRTSWTESNALLFIWNTVLLFSHFLLLILGTENQLRTLF